MAKKKSVKKAPIGLKAKDLVPALSTPLEIETAPPPPQWKGNKLVIAAIMQSVDDVIPKLKPGHAFLIPAQQRMSVRKHLTTTFPTKVFVINAIPGNKTQLRVYFLRELAPNR